jgi:hypothetical protein
LLLQVAEAAAMLAELTGALAEAAALAELYTQHLIQ